MGLYPLLIMRLEVFPTGLFCFHLWWFCPRIEEKIGGGIVITPSIPPSNFLASYLTSPQGPRSGRRSTCMCGITGMDGQVVEAAHQVPLDVSKPSYFIFLVTWPKDVGFLSSSDAWQVLWCRVMNYRTDKHRYQPYWDLEIYWIRQDVFVYI